MADKAPREYEDRCRVLSDLFYYIGKNQRPDALNGKSLWIEYKPGSLLYEIVEDRPYYIQQTAEETIFVEEPEASNYTLEFSEVSGKLIVDIHPHDIENKGYEFTLQNKPDKIEYIGEDVFDNHYANKLQATWWGSDAFLREFGGDEYAFALDKERIDFIVDKEIYSVFVSLGEILVFAEGKWHNLREKNSKDYPMLVVKKIDNQHLTLCLYSQLGTRPFMHQLSCLTPQQAVELGGLKFVGAKTQNKWIICSKSNRFIIEPGDWLLYQNKEGWTKLTSLSDIENYVHTPMIGYLFIVESVACDTRPCQLVGKLVNPQRTAVNSHQIVLH